MRIPRALSRALLSPVGFAILAVSTLGAQADIAINRKPASSIASTERLVLTPANLRFGKVAIGRQDVRTVTITNSGDSNITLLRVVTTGTDFSLSGLDLPVTLAGGESFTFSGVFAPRSRGDRSGSVSFVSGVSSNASRLLVLELAGTATDPGQLNITPATLDFGTVQVGSLATQGGQLTASSESVTIFSANLSSSEFILSGLSFPFTIPAGRSQGYTVTFAPRNSGAASATLFFMSDSQGSMTFQSLTGTGAIPNTHSVDLSWNASTSEDVIGYNVYRSNTSGGPYQKINSVLDASTAYTDSSVTGGNTYYYVATAVDTSNQESVYSNEAQAVIPTHYSGMPGSMSSPGLSRRLAKTDSPSRHFRDFDFGRNPGLVPRSQMMSAGEGKVTVRVQDSAHCLLAANGRSAA
jgi:hypothetical protein